MQGSRGAGKHYAPIFKENRVPDVFSEVFRSEPMQVYTLYAHVINFMLACSDCPISRSCVPCTWNLSVFLVADSISSLLCNSQILYHSILGWLFRALSPRSHMEFKSFSEAKRCDSPWDSPLALSLHLRLPSLSLTYFSTLYFPLLCCSTQESWGAHSVVNQFHLVCFHIFIQS